MNLRQESCNVSTGGSHEAQWCPHQGTCRRRVLPSQPLSSKYPRVGPETWPSLRLVLWQRSPMAAAATPSSSALPPALSRLVDVSGIFIADRTCRSNRLFMLSGLALLSISNTYKHLLAVNCIAKPQSIDDVASGIDSFYLIFAG